MLTKLKLDRDKCEVLRTETVALHINRLKEVR